MAVKETIIDLRHTVGGVELYAKAAEYDSDGNKITTTYSTVDATETALATKQDKPSSSTVGDIATFDSGSSTVDSGKAFLNSSGTWDGTSDSLVPTAKSIQSKLDEKYARPVSGIPKTDMDSTVNASLGKADSAIQHVYAGQEELVPVSQTVTIPYAGTAEVPVHEYVIGEHTYRSVSMADGNEWLAENLDFKFTGLTVGASGLPSTPSAWYYNNDETNYGIEGTYKCGLIYNWFAVEYIINNDLIPGWHIATKAEWDNLVSAIGGLSYAGQYLKAMDNSITSGYPSSWNGTDIYTFGVLPGGMKSSDYYNNFGGIGTLGRYWTGTETAAGSDMAHYRAFTDYRATNSQRNYKTEGYYVRLVKNTPPATTTAYTSGLMTSGMNEKLDGIEAHAEVNVQADWNVSDNTSDAFIKNKPSLATVATSGSYTDLSNTPTIPVVPESTTVTIDSTAYLRTYDGHSVYAARTDCDKNGAKLTLGINGNVDVLLDENNEPVLDENGDEVISNNSTAMVSTIGGVPLMAATSSIPYVEKTASATITMENNAFNKIVGTPPATMTLACSAPPEQAVSFVAQVTAGNTDSTLVVQVNGQPTLYNKAAGNTLEANKTYQISCLNNCWTMAAFEVPV